MADDSTQLPTPQSQSAEPIAIAYGAYITQQEIHQGRVHKEWMLFNEFAVMQQIYRD